jgi:hypothetical protein
MNIGFIEGNGTTTKTHSYSYNDNKAKNNFHFFSQDFWKFTPDYKLPVIYIAIFTL